MKRPLRRQWYDAVDPENDANQLLVQKRRFCGVDTVSRRWGRLALRKFSARCLTS